MSIPEPEIGPRENVNLFGCGCLPGPCVIVENYKSTGNNLFQVVLKHKKKPHAYLLWLIFYDRLKIVTPPGILHIWQNSSKNIPKKSLILPQLSNHRSDLILDTQNSVPRCQTIILVSLVNCRSREGSEVNFLPSFSETARWGNP